jgi:hypothetical protein
MKDLSSLNQVYFIGIRWNEKKQEAFHELRTITDSVGNCLFLIEILKENEKEREFNEEFPFVAISEVEIKHTAYLNL